jgi:hypothetical protein
MSLTFTILEIGIHRAPGGRRVQDDFGAGRLSLCIRPSATPARYVPLCPIVPGTIRELARKPRRADTPRRWPEPFLPLDDDVPAGPGKHRRLGR